ncbi:uncharacterized protein LOC119733246 isoform X2 [Patiria miniata]|uniref:Uncharacterized protein n=1 Tax=Patiria miniata TaxID=46514 RepID=A0A914AH89_PATMI|nr:uncharacterized protein LOC119733246 isoform X2 [Patiria miniata]
MAEPPDEGAQRQNETQTLRTQTNPGPSTAQDIQTTPTQQVPAGNEQPFQQEPTQQPPPHLQPRPGETQTNPGPSTAPTSQEAPTQQLPADGVRDAQQTTQSGSIHPFQQEPTQQPPPHLQPRPGETQTNPGPSTAPTSQEAPTQQLPADGVRDAQQTTQSGSIQPSQQEPTQQPPSQLQPRPERKLDVEPPHASDNVMRALEADAKERATKRKAEATVLKDQGNQAFNKGDYTRAVKLYTQGLEHLKDFVVLYTNRAQAYNKLEKFTEALEDCRTALQLEPNNVKALLHLGKAQQGLKDYEAAVRTYKEILKIDEKYEKMVAGYIAAVNLAEPTAKSDMEAKRLFSEGDVKATGVHEIRLSEVTDSQEALTQQLPDDQQTTQSGSGQPSQQEPTQQPPPQLQPRPKNAAFPFKSDAETLATKLGRGRPTEVNCQSNDLKTLSDYLQNVTPPLEGTYFNMNVEKQELTLLRGILLSDSMKSARLIHVNYHLSEREEEELSLLEETLCLIDEPRCGLAFFTLFINENSWFDTGRISHSIFRIHEQIDWLGLAMYRRSLDEVVDLLKALEGCRLSSLALCDINLHSRVRHVSHIPSYLPMLELIACRLVDDDMKDLISILPDGHYFFSLALDYNSFSLDAVRALTHHLQGLPELGVLSLCYIDCDPRLVKQVVGRNLPYLKEKRDGYFKAY